MGICVVASGKYYQQYFHLKPGDIISDNGMTYKSILNTCSKYYNSGNGKKSGNTSISAKNSSKKYSLSVVFLLQWCYSSTKTSNFWLFFGNSTYRE